MAVTVALLWPSRSYRSHYCPTRPTAQCRITVRTAPCLPPRHCTTTHCRKLTPHKLLSPNTLSVELVCGAEEESGQAVPPVRPAHSPLSPVRGISYPPLSPKSLKRHPAIQQSPRAPPLSRLSTPDPAGLASPGEGGEGEGGEEGRAKRGGRAGPDNRRYHTAGTIEDLKVGRVTPGQSNRITMSSNNPVVFYLPYQPARL